MSNYKKVKNWFRKDGQFSWGCGTKKVKQYPCGSIDVFIKEMYESIDLECTWTIISDDDAIYEDANPNNQSNLTITVPHTHKFVQIYAVNDNDQVEYEEVWPSNIKMPQEIEQKIEEAKKSGKAIKQGNAWNPKIVSKSISDWVWRQTGLTVDFNFDDSINGLNSV